MHVSSIIASIRESLMSVIIVYSKLSWSAACQDTCYGRRDGDYPAKCKKNCRYYVRCRRQRLSYRKCKSNECFDAASRKCGIDILNIIHYQYDYIRHYSFSRENTNKQCAFVTFHWKITWNIYCYESVHCGYTSSSDKHIFKNITTSLMFVINNS